MNAVLTAALETVAPHLLEDSAFDSLSIRLRGDTAAGEVADGLQAAYTRFGDDLALVQPAVSETALQQLRFHELLPPHLAQATLASRIGQPLTPHSVARRIARS